MRPVTATHMVGLTAAAVMTAAYAFLPMTMPGIDNSPDETANRVFATEFAEQGRLWRSEPLDAIAPDVVHPRSVRFARGVQVPIGFIGLPVLYGGVAAIVGTWVIPWLTPIIAALAVLAWAGLTGRFLGKRFGIIAGALLAVQPAWWYAASRTLQPNVLFVSLLIMSAWCYALSAERRYRVVLSGVLLGLALAVRMSEAYWIALAAGFLLLVARDRSHWVRASIVAVSAAAALVPFLIIQHGLYGGLLATGYGNGPATEVAGAFVDGRAARLLGPLQPYLFPLGLAPRLALKNFLTYGIAFFWWWSALVGVAVAAYTTLVVRRSVVISRRVMTFAGAATLMAGWLILFYGSWRIQDNPDPNAVTIGASYLRYWLPLSVASTLPIAWLLTRVMAAVRPRTGIVLATVLLAGIGAASTAQVFAAPQEGLLTVRENLQQYAKDRDVLLAATEPESVIVADYFDKILYPHRHVAYPLRSEHTYAALPKLAATVPVYYFGITFPESDLTWLNTVKLPPLGLSIAPVLTLREQTLYRFTTVAHDNEPIR